VRSSVGLGYIIEYTEYTKEVESRRLKVEAETPKAGDDQGQPGDWRSRLADLKISHYKAGL